MTTITQHTPSYPIRRIPMSRPFVWLARGWDDLLHHRAASLAYGFIVSAMGFIILAYERHPFFVAAAVSGFLLVGPIMAAGLCELSRCRDLNQTTNFDISLKALRRNHDNLLSLANTLLFLGLVWFVFSYMVMQSAIGTVAPAVGQTIWGDVLHYVTGEQIIAYIISGGMLSIIVFSLSVVTVPMIIDHHVDARTAMKTSLRVTIKDLPAILVWGALIVALIGVGFATFLIGMIVVFPLLGHATWYAYRDLVKQ